MAGTRKVWLIESPTYLSKYTLPVLGICQSLTLLAPTQSDNLCLLFFGENFRNLVYTASLLITPCPLGDRDISEYFHTHNILKTSI